MPVLVVLTTVNFGYCCICECFGACWASYFGLWWASYFGACWANGRRTVGIEKDEHMPMVRREFSETERKKQARLRFFNAVWLWEG